MLKKVLSIILMNIFLAASSLLGASGAWADKGGNPNEAANPPVSDAAKNAPAWGQKDANHSQGQGHDKGQDIHDVPDVPSAAATAI